MTSSSLFAQGVVETEDIDSFVENDTAITTTTNRTKSAKKRITHKIFSLGIGLNFGFYTGKIGDVNTTILRKTNRSINELDYWLSDNITQGEAKMYLNLVPRITINFMPVRYLMIQILGEAAWGPKIIMTLDDTWTYHYMRYSPGLILNGYIPLGKTGKYSLFIGGGAFYHFLEFEAFKAQGIGGRGQLGLRIDWSVPALEVFVAYDYARGETGQYNYYLGHDMLLDYSSILIGVNLYFKIR